MRTRTISVDDYAGDVVVMNFWASWCGPCRSEQPELNDAAEALADMDVSFLGVNVKDDSSTNALSHEAEFAIPYPSIEDPAAEFAARFSGIGPRTLPSTVLIDRQGRVAVSLFGQTVLRRGRGPGPDAGGGAGRMSGPANVIFDANLLIAATVAFAAGVVSFASPCVIPLVPGYLSFMTGLSGEELAVRGPAATRAGAGRLAAVRGRLRRARS